MGRTKKEIILGIFGVILTPIFVTVFIIDRVALSVLPWRPYPKLGTWIDDHQAIAYSCIRFLIYVIAALIIF